MFSGVFFWHVDTPIYRDLIWQPSELGPHGEKRGGEGWVLVLLFICFQASFAFSRLEPSAAEAAGAEEEVYWVCVNSSLSFRPQTCQPHHHHYCSMLKFSVNGIVGNVWFLCNTDLKYRLLASTKLNLAFFCVRKLNLHFVAICPTCSYLQECPTVQISKSPGQAAWWIFTGMKIRIWNKSCSSVLLEAPSEDDISESKGKMLTIPEECCHGGSIAQIPCQCPITLIARSYQLSDGRAEMKKTLNCGFHPWPDLTENLLDNLPGVVPVLSELLIYIFCRDRIWNFFSCPLWSQCCCWVSWVGRWVKCGESLDWIKATLSICLHQPPCQRFWGREKKWIWGKVRPKYDR